LGDAEFALSEAILSSFKCARELVLENHFYYEVRDFASVANVLPALESLSLQRAYLLPDQVNPSNFLQETRIAPALPAGLRTLRIIDAAEMQVPLLTWLVNLPSVPNLEALDTGVLSPQVLKNLGMLLKALGPHLLHLTIDLYKYSPGTYFYNQCFKFESHNLNQPQNVTLIYNGTPISGLFACGISSS
jgi:hypothetical protein